VLTNAAFLDLMFANRPVGALPRVAAFALPPKEAGRRDWTGWPARGSRDVPSGDRNTYTAVSTFYAGPDGKHRRRKANFAAMHAVMIDDVGTKVAESAIVLPATVRVETSPGNFQDWLRLEPPITDRALAERLVDRMIAAGLTADGTDPGMAGVTRYGRLPEGVNNKARPTGPWRHQVLEVRTDHAYTADEIADAYGLDLAPPPEPMRRPCPRPTEAGTPADPLEWFRAMGMYQAPLGGGWHAVTCPWVDEHTDRADTGSAYGEPSAENAFWGGYVCHHGHCRRRRGIRDVFAWMRSIMQEVRA
jgi:hypothetical protein